MPDRYTPQNVGPPPTAQDVSQGLSSGPSAQSYDALFAGLLELQWRDIGIPCTKLSTRLRQDLAIQKFADRNGAHIEGTGRSPYEFTAHVPFLNGLDRGANERWARPLYPFTRDKILVACMDKSSGTLQHPELGAITCKVQTFSWDLDAHTRGGVYAEIVWIESDDTGDSVDAALASPSPLANALAAAADLDFQLGTVNKAIIPMLPTFPTSFSDFMNAVRGTVDQATLFSKSFAGRIDGVIYQVQALQDSLTGANASSLNWPLVDACERMKTAAYDIKSTQLLRAKPIKLYVVQKDSTLSQIATAIGANVADLMTLNRSLVQSPIVSSGTVVRYYA